MSQLQTYSYRIPRFPLELPIEFWSEGTSIPGFTRNLSDTGIQVRLKIPVMPGSCGRLGLSLDTCRVEFEVEVAHSELLYAGMRFKFSCEAEAHFVRTLVKVLARGIGRSGPYVSGIRQSGSYDNREMLTQLS